MWKDKPEIYVVDPTLKLRVINIDPPAGLPALMRAEMDRVKKDRTLFGRLKKLFTFVS